MLKMYKKKEKKRHLRVKQIHFGGYFTTLFCFAKSKHTGTMLDFATGWKISLFSQSCLVPYSATHNCEAKSVGLDQFHHLSRDVSSAESGRSTKQTKTKTEPLWRLIDRTWRLARSLRRLAPSCPPWGLAEQNTGKNRRASGSERVQTLPPSGRGCACWWGGSGGEGGLGDGGVVVWKCWTRF